MEKIRKIACLALILVLITSASAFAYTDEFEDDDMWTKLGRGTANVLTGWLEIFHQPHEMGKIDRAPIAILGGFWKGLFYGVVRTGVGLYEVVTFPIPIPDHYRAIMDPEFIVPSY